jgi:hypothetical protein
LPIVTPTKLHGKWNSGVFVHENPHRINRNSHSVVRQSHSRSEAIESSTTAFCITSYSRRFHRTSRYEGRWNTVILVAENKALSGRENWPTFHGKSVLDEHITGRGISDDPQIGGQFLELFQGLIHEKW